MVVSSYIFIFVTLAFGYFCLKFLHFSKYRITKYSGQELFFSSAIAGLMVFGSGYLFCRILLLEWPEGIAKLSAFFPNDGTFYIVAGYVISLPLIKVANWIYSNDDAIAKQIEEQNDGFESLLQTSQQYLKPLIISLDSGKVYIGVVNQSFFSPVENRSFQILPFYSGFRDKETKEMKITNEYVDFLDAFEKSNGERINDLTVSLPVRSIMSMSIFNADIYKELNQGA